MGALSGAIFYAAFGGRVNVFFAVFDNGGCGLLGRNRREAVFPEVDNPCGRGLMAPPGLTALGAKGSACDRHRLTGGLRAPPRVVI